MRLHCNIFAKVSHIYVLLHHKIMRELTNAEQGVELQLRRVQAIKKGGVQLCAGQFVVILTKYNDLYTYHHAVIHLGWIE